MKIGTETLNVETQGLCEVLGLTGFPGMAEMLSAAAVALPHRRGFAEGQEMDELELHRQVIRLHQGR